jgi:hypothetical protein
MQAAVGAAEQAEQYPGQAAVGEVEAVLLVQVRIPHRRLAQMVAHHYRQDRVKVTGTKTAERAVIVQIPLL